VDHNTAMCRDLVAGLSDAGVELAFISPGSRNAPLTLAFALSEGIEDFSIRDERSAGFLALGAARASGVPAVVVCTSGSAAAHYLPAIAEADQTSTPMIVVTADRPVELRGTFAPQTMDQTHLYGSHVKATFEIGSPSTDWRETAHAIVDTSLGGIAGPVHVNVPLAEPLVPDAVPDAASAVSKGAAERAAHHTVGMPDLAEELAGKRVLIVAGGSCDASFPGLLAAYAGSLSAPVIAGPQSRSDHPTTIRSADMLARTGHLDAIQPEVILRLGGLPTSKSVWNWLETCGVPQILVGRSRLADPLGSATLLVDASQTDFVSRAPGFMADAGFLDDWQEADRFVANVVDTALDSGILTEPAVARAVTAVAPPGSVVFVGSSMPIRDVDTFGMTRSDVRIIANRGVNGIDGSISTALGISMAGVPTTALIGDVAAIHDVTALSEISRLGAQLRVVVINNDGGGIFSFLPQRRSGIISDDVYEKHWGTPHGLSLAAIAGSMGLAVRQIDAMDDFTKAVGSPIRPELIEVATDRDENVDAHRAISAAVRQALDAR
jgi:2-succinyl-5-enolpyruvyl-6-hydroxy-3-cyclohexene-1-carboxylate synthase